MSKSVYIDDGSFNQIVLPTERSVLVDFWGTWCKLSPTYSDLDPKRAERSLDTAFD